MFFFRHKKSFHELNRRNLELEFSQKRLSFRCDLPIQQSKPYAMESRRLVANDQSVTDFLYNELVAWCRPRDQRFECDG